MYTTVPEQQYMTQFELASLAFADIVDREINGETEQDLENKEKHLSNGTIRCICGKTECKGELIQCSECQCYLHKDCLELTNQRTSGYRCPFCKLQLDGVDPFRELKMWIDDKDSEIKNVHKLLTDASQIDQKIRQSSYDSYGPRMGTQNTALLRQNLQTTLQEVIERIRNLSSV